MKKNDNRASVLRRSIYMCWGYLLACFLIKIFGGNLFTIICNDKNFINICNIIEKSFILKLIIGSMSTLYCELLFILAILQKNKPTKFQFLLILTSAIVTVTIKLISQNIGYIADIWQMIILPFLLLNNKKYWWKIILGNIYIFIFQLISLYTKNLCINNISINSFLIQILFMIDIYIMYLLYYLYNMKKEE